MKETKEFQSFQREFKRYQQLLGLTGYKVYFKHEPIEDCFADIICDQVARAATVRLNSLLPDKDKPHRDSKGSAKHEALHLLLNNLLSCAMSRYIREGEIREACEELVFKLEELIP